MVSLLRPRRALKADLRFVLGIALVVVSILGVWLIVSGADRTVPILRAARTISAGESVHAEDFQVVEVTLGPLEGDYLGPGRLAPGQVAARTLPKGELVPASAVTEEERTHTTTVVVESTTAIPEDVRAGAEVEIWQAPLLEDGRSHDAPRILVGDAIVRSVIQPDGMLADTGTQVEIVVDRGTVADVLAAVTGGAALSVIPIGAGS